MSFPRFSGVYAIIHVESGRLYIGSASNIYSRWRQHQSELRRSLHHSPHLQNAWNKYGEVAFAFRVIERCLKDKVILWAREQVWLDKYRNQLFNISKEALTSMGRPATAEERAANSKRMMGNKCGEGTHYHGKLTERNIVEIMHRYAAGESSAELAKAFDVSMPTISRIATRKTWWRVEVPEDIAAICKARAKLRISKGNRNPRSKLSQEQVNEAKEKRAAGATWALLATEYDVTPAAIRCAVLGKTYKKAPTVEIPIPPAPENVDAPLPKVRICRPRTPKD